MPPKEGASDHQRFEMRLRRRRGHKIDGQRGKQGATAEGRQDANRAVVRAPNQYCERA